MQDGGHLGGVFGWLLALAEAEGHRLDPVVVMQRAAKEALVGRLNLLHPKLHSKAEVRAAGVLPSASNAITSYPTYPCTAWTFKAGIAARSGEIGCEPPSIG